MLQLLCILSVYYKPEGLFPPFKDFLEDSEQGEGMYQIENVKVIFSYFINYHSR